MPEEAAAAVRVREIAGRCFGQGQDQCFTSKAGLCLSGQVCSSRLGAGGSSRSIPSIFLAACPWHLPVIPTLQHHRVVHFVIAQDLLGAKESTVVWFLVQFYCFIVSLVNFFTLLLSKLTNFYSWLVNNRVKIVIAGTFVLLVPSYSGFLSFFAYKKSSPSPKFLPGSQGSAAAVSSDEPHELCYRLGLLLFSCACTQPHLILIQALHRAVTCYFCELTQNQNRFGQWQSSRPFLVQLK